MDTKPARSETGSCPGAGAGHGGCFAYCTPYRSVYFLDYKPCFYIGFVYHARVAVVGKHHVVHPIRLPFSPFYVPKGLSLKIFARCWSLRAAATILWHLCSRSFLFKLIQTPDFSSGEAIFMFFKQLVLITAGGLFLGKLSVRIINKMNLDNDALYSVLLFTIMFFLFGFTSFT